MRRPVATKCAQGQDGIILEHFGIKSRQDSPGQVACLLKGKLQVLKPGESMPPEPPENMSRPSSARFRQSSAGRIIPTPTKQIDLSAPKVHSNRNGECAGASRQAVMMDDNIKSKHCSPDITDFDSDKKATACEKILPHKEEMCSATKNQHIEPELHDEKQANSRGKHDTISVEAPDFIPAIVQDPRRHPDSSGAEEDEDDSEDEEDSEGDERKAPIELLGEFLQSVMDKNYTLANKLCQMILIYEPDNPEAKQFIPVIEEKLLIDQVEEESEEEEEEEEEEEDSDAGEDSSDQSDSSESEVTSSGDSGTSSSEEDNEECKK
ncbi:glutamate-rich protein 2 isoform X2 [Amia ocellicauda]|uniref:glutamate-rich protein 2 isoform X2 n=1 Tax=Amia ocellicauda TaxID=2972642 RepID=UPI0034647271